MIPITMRQGERMLKVTQNKVAMRLFRVDTESASIVWESKRGNSVRLYAVRDVRVGESARSYRHSLQISDEHEPRWISIIYQTARAYKAVHMVALSDESLARWRDSLLRILAQWHALVSGRVTASRAQGEWLQASWDVEKRLDQSALARLCQRMGVQISRPELDTLFLEADRERVGALNFEAFQRFVAALKRRPDVEQLFYQLAKRDAQESCSISLSSFTSFLHREQGEWKWTSDDIAHIYQRYRVDTLDGFAAFLMSRDNGAYNDPVLSGGEAAGKEKESGSLHARTQASSGRLDEPLSSYYISSSHNTYLEGGQWKGDSTVEGYVRALHKGARCVELDCWDGPGGQPQVTHGHTLTSRVPLDDVVAAVAQYAFVASPYPLILSLEVHNDLAQQVVLANILQARLGDMLVTAPLDDDVQPGMLPSPEQLRFRILVKCKDHVWIHSQVSQDADDQQPLPQGRSSSSTEQTEWESDSFLDQARNLVRLARHRTERGKIARPLARELVRLLVYTVGVPFRGLNKKEQYAAEHMFSLSERSAARLMRQSHADLVKHNLTHLTRVYPSMTKLSRLTSSANFLPMDMWASGCQLVALNWQTHDQGMSQNLALFARSAGYVRKPSALRVKSCLKNDGGTLLVSCVLTIVSAQQVPHMRSADEAVCPYAAVSVDVPHQWGKDAVQVSVPAAVPRESPSMATCQGDSLAGCTASGLAASGAGSRTRSTGSGSGSATRAASLGSTPSPSTSLLPSSSSSSASSTGVANLLPPISSSAPVSSRRSPFRTPAVRSNGLNPVWQTSFLLDIRMPAGHDAKAIVLQRAQRLKHGKERTDDPCVWEDVTRGLLHLCFVQVQICDEQTSSQVPLATTTLSLGRLRHGYRHVPLYDMQLSPLMYSSLFVHTSYTHMEVLPST